MNLWLWLLLRSLTNQSISLALSFCSHPLRHDWHALWPIRCSALRMRTNQNGLWYLPKSLCINSSASGVNRPLKLLNWNQQLLFFLWFFFLSPWPPSLFIFIILSFQWVPPRTLTVFLVLFLFSSLLPKMSVLTKNWILQLKCYFSLIYLPFLQDSIVCCQRG